MTETALDKLAHLYGVGLHHTAPDGQELYISDDTKRAILTALGVPCADEPEIEASLAAAGHLEPPVMRAVPNKTCVLPAWLQQNPAWGISLMLYELRSARNWGIGDFADLAAVSEIAAKVGADFVGVNPLHALFLADPARCSPFSPSNRLFLNPLYIAVDQVEGVEIDAETDAELQRLRALDAVDYKAVARLKLNALKKVFACGESLRDRAAFEVFIQKGGDPLYGHALFETLSEAMVAKGHGAGWQDWPADLHDQDGSAVRAFAEENQDRISFHMWLQFLAASQLENAARAARDAGMRIGLYLDFAVGEVPDGSATWSNPDMALPGMTIGAPPDFFTAEGQEWGLAPPSPTTMRRTDFQHYRRTMQALTASAGALRVDHAMMLWQLFLVPPSGRPADGAYLRYPIEDMLSILADISQANETVVIGEDLGYVPSGFQDVMHDSNILSYRILYFQKDDGGFYAPKDYPALALACLSTHDLPTLRGWWRGDDVDLRCEHGLISEPAAIQQKETRRTERHELIEGMLWFGVLSEADREPTQRAAHDLASELPDAIMLAAHRMVAQTPSLLAGVRLADLTGEEHPTNLPGTVDSYPNWRLKNSTPLEALTDLSLFQSICETMRRERPRN